MDKIKNKWTKEEKEWLKINYHILRPYKCSIFLRRTLSSIKNMANELKLKIQYIEHINLQPFYKINDPEIAYFLGLLYADGSIKCLNTITLAILEEDALEIQHIISKIGKHHCAKIVKTYPRHDLLRFRIGSRGLWTFLFNHDYYMKSTRSADKILTKIPNKLKHYFFRGFLDGDGCIDRTNFRVSFAGSINQDWNFIIQLCNFLKIKYNIYKVSRLINNKSNSNSQISISEKDNNLIILNYIFQNCKKDKLGFSRKKNIF